MSGSADAGRKSTAGTRVRQRRAVFDEFKKSHGGEPCGRNASYAVCFEDCVFKGNRTDVAFRFFGDAPVFDECKFEGNKMKRWLPEDAKNDPSIALPLGPDGKELDISKLG